MSQESNSLSQMEMGSQLIVLSNRLDEPGIKLLKSNGDGGLSLKSYPTDWMSQGSSSISQMEMGATAYSLIQQTG